MENVDDWTSDEREEEREEEEVFDPILHMSVDELDRAIAEERWKRSGRFVI